MEKPLIHMMTFSVVTEVEPEHVKTMVIKHTACGHDVIGPATALPTMKEHHEALAFTFLWRIMT